MTQIVADGVLAKWHRRLHDWDERVLKGSLDPEEVAREVQNVIDRGSVFKRDMRKEGWKLLENVPRRITSVSELELVPFLKDGEDSIGGEELVLRARGELNANYGQEDAEWLLENQDKISKELRPFYLVFPGTVWESPDRDRDVASFSSSMASSGSCPSAGSIIASIPSIAWFVPANSPWTLDS